MHMCSPYSFTQARQATPYSQPRSQSLVFTAPHDINGASEAALTRLRPLSASPELSLVSNAHLTFPLTKIRVVREATLTCPPTG